MLGMFNNLNSLLNILKKFKICLSFKDKTQSNLHLKVKFWKKYKKYLINTRMKRRINILVSILNILFVVVVRLI